MSNQKTIAVLMVVCLFTIMIMVGCTSETSDPQQPDPQDEETIEIKMGYVQGTTEPIHFAAERFKERVAERTNGRVEIQTFPNGVLGNDRETMEQAQNNANIVSVITGSNLATFVPDLAILDAPYLTTTAEEKLEILETAWFEDMKQQVMENSGLRVLSLNWYYGTRHVFGNKPVPHPSDTVGMQIRIPSSKIYEETVRAMGASPTDLDWVEIYTGLAQNVIDGAEAPLAGIYTSNFYEVVDYVSKTGHIIAILGFAIGEEFYQTLPEDVQLILIEEMEDAGRYISQLTEEQDADFEQQLIDLGMTFVEVDLEAYKEIGQIVADQFPEWTPGLYEELRR